MSDSCDILVAEDDEHISFILQHAFNRSNYQTKLAADGKAAMKAVDELETPPKLVLLDVMMPYFDGLTVLKHIKTKSGWENVPVIMLTAKTQEQDIIHALDNGAADYIAKPFQIGELLARVKRYMAASNAS
jgi:DNA-binding response OmpR family regulator